MTDLLDNLRTPQQIAERISASTGVHIAARTVWEKAKRLGIGKKIGRTMLVSVDDIPLLLKEETKEDRAERRERERNALMPPLERLRKARAARDRANK